MRGIYKNLTVKIKNMFILEGRNLFFVEENFTMDCGIHHHEHPASLV